MIAIMILHHNRYLDTTCVEYVTLSESLAYKKYYELVDAAPEDERYWIVHKEVAVPDWSN